MSDSKEVHSSVPRVSVVILSYNGLDVVKKCLPSVVASTYENLEIIFTDNASSDGTLEWVEHEYPDVVRIGHPDNYLFCKGNNLAVEQATGLYVVLLNNDVEVDPQWLQPLVDRMESDEMIGAVQPKIIQYDDRERFEYAGAAGGHLDRFGYPFARGRIFFETERDSGQYNTDQEIFWASGAAMMMKKGLFTAEGGLDERLAMHMEEIDLCWRVQRSGFRIESVSQSVVYHMGGASLARGSSRKTYLNYRNNLLMLYKNLPPPVWRQIFIIRLVLDGLGIVRFIAKASFAEAFAVARAYNDAHRMKHDMKSERPATEDPVVLPDYRKSIVIDYFIRRKKHFTQLSDSDFRP